jgi:fatty-acyl-CoA synthase
METLGRFLDDCAARAPEREALAHAPRGEVVQRLSWRQLRDRSREAARKLLRLGAAKGSRIGVLCSNRPEWLPIAFGVFRLGAVLVPLSTLWKRDEIAYGLTHADVEILISLPGFLSHDYLASLRDIAPELAQARRGRLYTRGAPALRRVLLLGDGAPGMESWNDIAAEGDDGFLDALEARVSPTDMATIFFTSGTTAQAKAVVHAHGALTVSARRIAPCFGITPDDAWWGHMPLFWSGGFVLGAMATMAGGGRIVLQEVVDSGSALDLLEREGCTIMAGWHQAGPLLEHPGFAQRKLRLNKGTNHPLATRLLGPGHRAIGVYGMSETATCVAAARWDDPEEVRTETFGRPLEGTEIKIVDPEAGREAERGAAGEIYVKGPTLMEGYYRVPRAQAFDREGFFRTGDLGYLDERGYLHFATRLKDVIKTAGVNVAAAEVEETLARHANVKTAHVVGTPHPARGENVVAFVVLQPGATASEEELRSFCRQGLASYKVPRHVFFVAETDVPRTGSGKVEKVALRRDAERRLRGLD